MKTSMPRWVATVAPGALVGMLAVCGSAQAAGGGAQEDERARALEVRMHNATGCRLTRTDYGLTSGEFVARPPAYLDKGQDGLFKARSREGSLRGVAGRVAYTADHCDASWRDGHTVRLTFGVTYGGMNSFNSDGGGAFGTRLSGGSGNQAVLSWGVSRF
ncbi:hypothetical protein [Streptomyces sp. ME19-01-6]|uniref:hypothetical protein n=1 Tax=Streptomyces sp. ME19-01-6 TaxID=3028686 RepID=UPI0029B27C16|nr:hypothetical protein [Streptomyces sp. ME19-01-6]MDX3231165.1 hypothetical protein [Streptomyces sp. ME19-01-6]